jgi:hypothetical protein
MPAHKTRARFSSKEAQAAELQFGGLARPHCGKRRNDLIQFIGSGLADELERHVKVFRPHPAYLFSRRLLPQHGKFFHQLSEILSNRRRNLQRNEEAHGTDPF